MMNEPTVDMPGKDAKVSLREVTAETVRTICKLKVSEAQNKFVAPNGQSIAQAYFEPKAWFRAIYADETPVGFAMMYIDPEEPTYFLWRFMLDERYQKLGFGRQALLALIEFVRSQPNATQFYLSCEPAEWEGSPEPFYAGLGFERTGKIYDEEVEMKLELLAKKDE